MLQDTLRFRILCASGYSALQDTLRLLVRGAAIFLFLLFATVFTPVNHQYAGEAIFLACTWIA
jgi:hypothetical protein